MLILPGDTETPGHYQEGGAAMNFSALLAAVKENNQTAVEMLLEMYCPLLLKASITNGVFDEDLYHELCITFVNCLRLFSI